MVKKNLKNQEISNKDQLELILLRINEQHQEWLKFLSSLKVIQAQKPINGSWSAMDTFIHVTAWKENALIISKMLLDFKTPGPAPRSGPAGYLHINVEEFNDEIYQAHQGWTVPQAIAWGEKGNTELIESLRKLPYQRTLGGISKTGAQTWYWRPSFIHARGHRNDVIKRINAEKR